MGSDQKLSVWLIAELNYEYGNSAAVSNRGFGNEKTDTFRTFLGFP